MENTSELIKGHPVTLYRDGSWKRRPIFRVRFPLRGEAGTFTDICRYIVYTVLLEGCSKIAILKRLFHKNY